MPDNSQRDAMPADPVTSMAEGSIATVTMLRGLMEAGATLDEAAAVVAAVIPRGAGSRHLTGRPRRPPARAPLTALALRLSSERR